MLPVCSRPRPRSRRSPPAAAAACRQAGALGGLTLAHGVQAGPAIAMRGGCRLRWCICAAAIPAWPQWAQPALFLRPAFTRSPPSPLPLQVSHSEGGTAAGQEDSAASGQRRTIMQRTKAALQLWKALRVGGWVGAWQLLMFRGVGRDDACSTPDTCRALPLSKSDVLVQPASLATAVHPASLATAVHPASLAALSSPPLNYLPAVLAPLPADQCVHPFDRRDAAAQLAAGGGAAALTDASLGAPLHPSPSQLLYLTRDPSPIPPACAYKQATCCQGPCNGHMLGQSSTCGQGYSPDSIGLNQSAGFRQAAQCAQRRQRVGANEMLTVRLEVSDIHCARAQEQARWGERDSGERAHTGQVQAEARRQARCTRGQREGCCLADGPSYRPAMHIRFLV